MLKLCKFANDFLLNSDLIGEKLNFDINGGVIIGDLVDPFSLTEDVILVF